MIGAIIGDIVGSRFEFNNTYKIDFNFLDPACSFTDDTICTVAIADAILKGENYKDALLKWCRKYPDPMGGYGCGFARWLKSNNPEPYRSYGNGSAMRVSAVGWAFDSLEETLAEAERTAICTHNHPEGIKGAVAVAHAIWLLRNSRDNTDKLRSLESVASEYYPNWISEYTPLGVFSESCQGTVPLCFKIARYSTSFEDSIRRAVARGGDSDTIAAITGSITEAMFGVPKEISDKAFSYLDEPMLKVIGDFYHHLNNK